MVHPGLCTQSALTPVACIVNDNVAKERHWCTKLSMHCIIEGEVLIEEFH